MADRFVVTRPGPLFELLTTHLPTWGRNTLRSRLRLGCIDVNGVPVDRHDAPLQAGDVVVLRGKDEGRAVAARSPFVVLLDDEDLFAIDKPPGLLSVSTDDERERTALAMAREHLGRGRRVDLWPVHRLDRETSGVLLFARSRHARDAVQANWSRTEKVYAAVVEGHPEPPDGVVEAPLWEDDNLRVRVGPHATAKAARTRYQTVARGGGRSLLDVGLDTGRKHQIRAHLAWLGHPVVGDERYGTRGPRLCLHARRLSLPHPRDGREIVLTSAVPPALTAALSAP